MTLFDWKNTKFYENRTIAKKTNQPEYKVRYLKLYGLNSWA